MIELTFPLFVALLVLCIGAFAYAFYRKNIHLWIGCYILQAVHRKPKIKSGPVHIFLCIADHFEPARDKVPYEQECARVDAWVRRYPKLACKHKDARKRYPQHTFFYPEEEYRYEHLQKLAKLCKAGFGDVEIHLHHDGDSADSLKEKLVRFKTVLHKQHGLLHSNKESGVIEYGFIHGNWALDNSGKHGKWCGVNSELTVLGETGCYADFTFPSAPSETQTWKINSIYYATDDSLKPKSHNTGVDVEVGGHASGDLLMIQGPLSLNWKSCKWGILPKIENGEITRDNPPTRERVDLWIRQHIHVKEAPNWLFVKLHTHGAEEYNFEVLLGQPMDDMFSYLETTYNDGARYQLHYVTAREMYDLIKAAERGEGGSPEPYLIKKDSIANHDSLNET